MHVRVRVCLCDFKCIFVVAIVALRLNPALKAFQALEMGCYKRSLIIIAIPVIVQELCESRGGRPGLSVLTSLLVSVDVKNY